MSEARSFLDWVFADRGGGGVLVVSRKDRSASSQGSWRDEPVADVAGAEALVMAHRESCDVYVATCEFESGRGRTSDAAIGRSIITLDIDAKDMPGNSETDRLTAASRLAHAVGAQGVIVATGGGFHVHVRLPAGQRLQDRPMPEGRLFVELCGRALRLHALNVAQRLFGTSVKLDVVHDLARVVRVPDTFNRKNPGAPRPVYIEQPRAGGASLVVPDFDTTPLATHWQAAFDEHTRSAAATRTGPASPGIATVVVPPAMASTWPLPNGDQSAHDFAVARALAEAGHPRAVAVATLLDRRARLPCQEDRAKALRPDYVERTVAAAYAVDGAELHDLPSASQPVAAIDELRFRTIDEIGTDRTPEVEWFWAGVLARRGMHLLAGKPKESGKTTLTMALAGALERGEPLLGRPTMRTGSVIICEEHWATIIPKALQFGVKEARWLTSADRGRVPWGHLIEKAVQIAVADGRELLVVDTLAAWASFEDEAENSSAAMLRALAPLRRARDAGLTVLLTHHARKGESSVSDAPRGSGALAGDMDMLLQLGPAPKAPAMRQLEVVGRFCIESTKVVYGRGADGLFLASDSAVGSEVRNRLIEALRKCPGGLNSGAWEASVGMNRTMFQNEKRALLEEGVVIECHGRTKRERIFRLPDAYVQGDGGGDAVPPLTGENHVPLYPSPSVDEVVLPRGTGSAGSATGDVVPSPGTGSNPIAADPRERPTGA